MRAAGGCESKACEEMEKKGFDQQPEEAQSDRDLRSTIRFEFSDGWIGGVG